MTLTQEPLTITLTEPVNLRDLAGTPVADGVIAPGFAVRSDDLATITEQAANRLFEDGLRGVIDLRSRDEVFITGRGPLLEHSVAYHHVPYMGSIKDATQKPDATAAIAAAAGAKNTMAEMPSMHDMYVSLFANVPATIVSTLAILAHSEGTTAFHCAAGKDRTGVLAAALLLTLGADDDTIIEDYRKTYRNLDGIMLRTREYMGHVMARAGIDPNILKSDDDDVDAQRARDEVAMEQTLATLRNTYGDPLTPLYEAGLTTALIDTLRQRAVSA